MKKEKLIKIADKLYLSASIVILLYVTYIIVISQLLPAIEQNKVYKNVKTNYFKVVDLHKIDGENKFGYCT